jgi:hypothetical protein
MVNMVKMNANTFQQKSWTQTTMKQMINKALHTIQTQCEELQIERVAQKLFFKHS